MVTSYVKVSVTVRPSAWIISLWLLYVNFCIHLISLPSYIARPIINRTTYMYMYVLWLALAIAIDRSLIYYHTLAFLTQASRYLGYQEIGSPPLLYQFVHIRFSTRRAYLRTAWSIHFKRFQVLSLQGIITLCNNKKPKSCYGASLLSVQ